MIWVYIICYNKSSIRILKIETEKLNFHNIFPIPVEHSLIFC